MITTNIFQSKVYCDQNLLKSDSTSGLINPYNMGGTAPVNLGVLLSNEWPMLVPYESLWEPAYIPEILQSNRLFNPLSGRENLDKWLKELSFSAPSVEEVWKITERLPSLSKLLSDERENE